MTHCVPLRVTDLGLPLRDVAVQPARVKLLGAGGWSCGMQRGAAPGQHIRLCRASAAHGEPRAIGEPRQDSGDPANWPRLFFPDN